MFIAGSDLCSTDTVDGDGPLHNAEVYVRRQPVQETTISLQWREKVGSTVACTEVAIDLEVLSCLGDITRLSGSTSSVITVT